MLACFNGAAVFQPRKHYQFGRSIGVVHHCFNGAAVFQPRKLKANSQEARCGASFNGAAVFQPRKPNMLIENHPADLASMGPRSFNRGNNTAISGCQVQRIHQRASMGPRSFNRGNVLQRTDCERLSRDPLQWGRGHSTAETLAECHAGTRLRTASMGPRSFNRGNRPQRKS